MNEPIWITGCGVGTPHGWTFDQVADGLLAGRSAVTRVAGFDVSQHPAQIGSTLGPMPAMPGLGDDFATICHHNFANFGSRSHPTSCGGVKLANRNGLHRDTS